MTNRDRFIRTLRCEEIGGRVPHFELNFYLTMEAFGKVHPWHRFFWQWDQMSASEKKLQINDMADVLLEFTRKYDHSAILLDEHHNVEIIGRIAENIREKTGDEYCILIGGDPTWAIPDGDSMMDFAVQMLEEPEELNAISKRRVEKCLDYARKINANGQIADGVVLYSDYCFNVNPFFTTDQFEELIVPYLKEIIDEYRKMGLYSIKHTDGNIMPILRQMADCKPDAIHSIDPQGGVNLREVRKIVGENIALIGNVNCGLLQTGTDEEVDADVMRSLREGMEDGKGYIFATSNCVYTGLPLERYERMWRIWREHGVYK